MAINCKKSFWLTCNYEPPPQTHSLALIPLWESKTWNNKTPDQKS